MAARWEPRLTSRSYEPELLPDGPKVSAIAGMGMTEKQGGSDVRANRTSAVPVAPSAAEPDGSSTASPATSGSARRP